MRFIKLFKLSYAIVSAKTLPYVNKNSDWVYTRNSVPTCMLLKQNLHL